TDFDVLHAQMSRRDYYDESRTVSPLKPAADAIHIDTTNIDAEAVVKKMLEIITQQIDQQSV
ncbi:MAG: (d)CMP kinase, partial [Planctomycetota bacterium]